MAFLIIYLLSVCSHVQSDNHMSNSNGQMTEELTYFNVGNILDQLETFKI